MTLRNFSPSLSSHVSFDRETNNEDDDKTSLTEWEERYSRSSFPSSIFLKWCDKSIVGCRWSFYWWVETCKGNENKQKVTLSFSTNDSVLCVHQIPFCIFPVSYCVSLRTCVFLFCVAVISFSPSIPKIFPYRGQNRCAYHDKGNIPLLLVSFLFPRDC